MHGKLFKSLICVLIIATFAFAAALTSGASDEPSMTIDYYNLSYSQYTFVMYAVHAEGIDTPEEIRMLFWASPQDEYLVNTETYSTAYYGQQTIRGENYEVFHSGGITPKKLIDTIYCRAYVNVGGEDYYSEVVKYSPLKYIKDLLASPSADEAGKNLAAALRDYGAAAQIKFNWKTDDLMTDTHYYLTAQNAVLDDGFAYGLYKEGTELTLTAVVPEGETVARWADQNGTTLATCGNTLTLTLSGDTDIRAIYASDPDSCAHEYSAWIPAADPTCTEAGCVGHYTCTICGRDFDTDHNVIEGGAAIAALGHDWVDVDAVAPTCVPGHTAYRYCSRCDETEGYEEIAAVDEHDYQPVTVAPDGERRGYVEQTCSVCGETNGKSDYDYSLYSGVEFATAGKYAIPYNLDSSVYTIEASIQLDPTVTGRGGVIIGNYDAKSPAFNLEIYSGGKPRLFVMTVVNKVTTKYDYVFNTDIRSEDVKNIAITIEPGVAKLYVDGVLAETKELGDFVLPAPGRTMVLGGDNRAGNSQGFAGTVYSATVYRDVRTEDEIVSDLVIADANDQNCIFSYNLVSSDALTASVVLDNVQENAQAYNAEDLANHASHGTKNIEIMNDIVLDRTIYVIGDVTIFSNSNYSITRDPDFYGDMFVVGETATGRNLILDGITCRLTLSKADASGTLTVDGNKANVNDVVFGTLVYVNNSGYLTLNDGAALTNNRKTANSRTLGMQQYFANFIGGAAIINVNGTVTMNGGEITACECNFTDPANGDNTAENYLESCYGGAIFNYSNIVMNGGTISGNSGYYGGAIANYLVTELHGGVIENNFSSHAGGAIYNNNAEGRSIIIGDVEGENSDPSAVIFRGNYTTGSNGGAIYSGSEATVSIYGGATFDGNHTQGSGGALYLGSYGVIGPNTVFTNNYTTSSHGGAVFITSSNTAEVRATTIEGATFTNNTAHGHGGAIALLGTNTTITDVTATGNSAGYNAGAIYIDRVTSGDTVVGSDVTITGGTISGNSASGEAGAIFANYACEVGVTGTAIENNTSIGNGGAIALHGTDLFTLNGVTFSGNGTGTTTPAEGAGVAGNGGAIYASYRTITDNSDPENPVNTYLPSTVIATDCTFTENHSDGLGGAVMAIDHDNASTVFTATGCSFTDNDSASHGGALEITSTRGTVTNCTLEGNTAGANGGAIYCNSGAALTSTGSTFTGNSSTNTQYGGGALYFTGSTATLSGATFTDNSATTNGGAIAAYTNSSVTLTNVTATGNTAGNCGGFALAYNSTITVNASANNRSVLGDLADSTKGNSAASGGAIFCDNGSTLNISDTDVAYNKTTGSGAAFYFTTATGTISNCVIDHNTSGVDGAASYGGAMLVGYGSNVTITGSTVSNNTATQWAGAIYLRQGSNNAPSTVTATDTAFEGNSAIASTASNGKGGAIHVREYCTFTANGCSFTSNEASGQGGAAYVCGNGELITDVYGVTPTSFTSNTAPSGGAIYEEANATVDLTGTILSDNTTSGDGGAINAAAGSTLSLDSVTLDGNTAGGIGGAIYLGTGTTLTATDSLFNENTSVGIGGALYVNSATATLTDTDFTSNATTGSSAWYGGAIYTNGASVLTVSGGTFSGNSNPAGSGGAICARGTGSAAITGATFTNNSAKTAGGALHVFGITATVTDCTFDGNTLTNTTSSKGGAICVGNAANDNSVLTVNGGSIENGTAYSGGAIYVYGGDTLNLAASVDDPTVGVTFEGNSALGGGGGAIYADVDSTLTASKAVFDTNTTTGSGGALYAKEGAAVTFTDSDFTDNTAGNGGAMIIYGANVTLTNGTLSGNSSASGAIYLRQGGASETGTLDATGTTFSGNSCSGTGGGAVYINTNATFTADTVTFSNNTATGGGGAVFSNSASGQFLAENCTFTANSANGQGGAIYANNGHVELTDSIFNENCGLGDGSYYGGAIYANGTSAITVDGCTFIGNYSEKYAGGAISVRNTATLDITGSAFTGNYCKTTGGAIFIFESATATIDNSTFTGNYSTNNAAGAIQLGRSGNSDTASLALTDCTFTDNSATNGGAIRADGKVTLSATGTDFVTNYATGTGGAVYLYLDSTNADFTNCLFEGNTSDGNGGAVYHSAGTQMTWTNVTIKDNEATGSTAKGDAVYVTNGSGKSTYFTINSMTVDQNGGDPINIGNSSAYVTVTSSGVTDVHHSPVDLDLLIIGTKTHLTIN